MRFNTLTIETFSNVELFRASDTKGGGWNEYGPGYIRLNFIKDCDASVSDCRGKFQLTFHNKLTGAGGINILIVENLPFHLGIKEPTRLTFKALSQTIGNNGLINMYSMRFGSTEAASRLWHQASILQLAAKHANAGNPITIPSPSSLEGAAARAFVGTDQEEVERFLVFSRLTQLVANNPLEFSSSHSRNQAEVLFGTPLRSAAPPNEEKDNDNDVAENENSVDGSTCSSSSDVTSNTQPTPNEEGNLDDDETSSLGSYSDFPQSQDWAASFI